MQEKRYHIVGFMDLYVIHENNVRDYPNRTIKNIYNFLVNNMTRVLY